MKIKITHAEAMMVGSVLAEHAAVMDIDGKIYEVMRCETMTHPFTNEMTAYIWAKEKEGE